MYRPNGLLLRQERKKLRLSQAKLGEAGDVSRATVGNWERGKSFDFGMRSFQKVAQRLGYGGARFLLLLQDEQGQPPVPATCLPQPEPEEVA